MPLVMIPELAVTVYGLVGAPAAVVAMLFWKLDPGGFTLNGVSVDNWAEALTNGPGQIVGSLLVLGWAAPALARLHAHTVRNLLAPTEAELDTARLAQRVEELTKSRAGAVDRTRPARRYAGTAGVAGDADRHRQADHGRRPGEGRQAAG
jgi:hypothetical protein